jgi:hypothetical protein
VITVFVVAFGLFETTHGASNRNALPSQRMALVRLLDHRVLIMGGAGANGPTDAVWTVYPETRTWRMTGQLLRPKLSPAVMALEDGRVLVTGGCCPVTSDAEIYDPSTGRSSAVANMLRARMGHTLTRLPDGRIVALGGSNPSQALSSAEAFDLQSGRWVEFPRLRTARSLHATVGIGGGRLLVIGGITDFESSSGEIFDPIAGGWHDIVPYSRDLLRIEDAGLNVFGSMLLAERQRHGVVVFHSYNPSSKLWSKWCTSPDAHIDESALFLPDGDALLVGGSAGPPGQERARTGVLRLNWASGAFTRLPDLTVPRANPRLVVIADGLVMALGGYDGDAKHASLEFIETTASSNAKPLAIECRPSFD